ncbi:hypothetical protein BDR26DRAFT_1010094 [Obelidium mucronatum]|nr:hypothetical protein BDR26DRAFT_1010094 [Obelidium mucronatum]
MSPVEVEQLTAATATVSLKEQTLKIQPLKRNHTLDTFKSFKLQPHIGSEFEEGIQLRELLNAPNSDELFRDLAVYVAERNVIFFRNQDLTFEEQKEVADRLGKAAGKPSTSGLHSHPISVASDEFGEKNFPISSKLVNARSAAYGGGGSELHSRGWHSDVTFENIPSDYAVLRLREAPPAGGDTLWASAYELAEAGFATINPGPRGAPEDIGTHLSAVHPVIRTNPVTGWKGVFANKGFTKRINELSKDESDLVLNHLFQLTVQNHDLQVRFRWRKHDVAVWDNRSSYHSATTDFDADEFVRLGERAAFARRAAVLRCGVDVAAPGPRYRTACGAARAFGGFGKTQETPMVDFIISDQPSTTATPLLPGALLGDTYPLNIEARNLSVSVFRKKGKANILNNVNLAIPAGKLMAIMGSSGSGKTTLLNALAGRSGGQVTGDILFNGQDPATAFKSGLVAYVEQDDHLLPYVTMEVVESVILELGLKECADTLIGDDWRKGISGGEKRRVSVGVQLLTNPSVIFLDEPTTGLDAFNARSLIETLLNLAHKSNKTIILSIHQPRSDIFKYFDQIALLTRGGLLAYCGPPLDGVTFIKDLGFSLTEGVNGADFLVDAVSIDNSSAETEQESMENLQRIAQQWARVKPFVSFEETTSKMPSRRSESIGFFEQVSVISRRVLMNMWEDRLMQLGSFLNIVGMALVLGILNYKLDENPSAIFARQTLVYILSMFTAYFGILFLVYKLSYELKIFDRERRDNLYSVLAYLSAWLFWHVLYYSVLSVISSVILYFMVGMRASAYHFGMFTLMSILVQWAAIGFSWLFMSISRNYATASLAANLICSMMFAVGGFMIPVSSLPVYVAWMRHFTISYYALKLFALAEFKDRQFSCPAVPPNSPKQSLCNGNTILSAMEIEDPLYMPFMGILTLTGAVLLISGLLLYLLPPKGVAHAEPVWQTPEKGKEPESSVEIESSTLRAPPRITVQLNSLNFVLEPRNTKFVKAGRKTVILDRVSATFASGQLTAILGSSGAGKSTLLSLLQARAINLPVHLKSTTSGKLLHNGQELTKDVIEACTASVRQDDSHLLPSLTARETLVYAALLRLPKNWSKQRKILRAEEILVELGLKDCANTLVGSAELKGLSGGEKRRLSVGLAMLMDPSILILDEPTSGLDSASAKKMIITLESIAKTGRTIICSIHQPRSDIFPLLNRVLLLARGGQVVFEGEGSMLVPYLAEQQYHLPLLTNPADFALDVSSVDLRSNAAEEETRNRVSKLVNNWQTQQKSAATSQHSDSANRLKEALQDLSNSNKLPFAQALYVSISRSFLNLRRQPALALARIMNVFGAALITTLFFARIGLLHSDVISRIGYWQQVTGMINCGMLTCLAIFPQELLMFKFEHQDRTTSTTIFFLTYSAIEIPFDLAASVLHAVLAKYVVGLQANLGYTTLCIFACVFCGESIGMTFNTFFSKPGFSLQLMTLLFATLQQMSGLFSVSMPKFVEDLNYLSVLRYSSRILAAQEFLPSFSTGSDVMALFGFPEGDYHVVLNVVGLIICVVVYRLIAFVVLKIMFR